MAGKAIKKAYTVLHADSVIFIALALAIAGTAFLSEHSIINIVIRCLPFIVLMGITESIVYQLRMERRIGWLMAVLLLVAHIFFASLASRGLGFTGLRLPMHETISSGLAIYFILSAIYGALGLFSGQTLRNFFSRSEKIEKGN